MAWRDFSAADAEPGHQLRLGGQRVAGTEAPLDDQFLDLLLGAGGDRSHPPTPLHA
jgi:hypothetical protein